MTDNFTLNELTRSMTAKRLGIDNTPNCEQTLNLKALVLKVLQPARDFLNKPITVTSGFRSDYLNRRIGGAKNSQHTTGEAADLMCSDNKKLFLYIKTYLDFDQLIWEYGDDNQPEWIHVSYSKENRKEVLIKRNNEHYKPY